MARSTSETESGISSSFMRIGVMPPSYVLVRAMIPRAGAQRTVNAARSTDAGPGDVQQPLDGVGPFAGPQPRERAGGRPVGRAARRARHQHRDDRRERGAAHPEPRARGDDDAAATVVFVMVELHRVEPLIDVRLFANLRFSPASGAVTIAFFSFFGFIFLVTLFFQLVQAQGPLTTGIRILPVALSIALGSILGTRLAAGRPGTKPVVTTGLLMLRSRSPGPPRRGPTSAIPRSPAR